MILNYTTKISVDKTVGEIQAKLAKAKAQAIMCEYDDGIVSHLAFRIQTPYGMMMFRLPANPDGVLAAMKRSKLPRVRCTKEQAAKVAWRIVKDWVEAQLAIVEAEMATLPEIFLPYAQADNGKTVYQNLLDKGFPALTHSAA